MVASSANAQGRLIRHVDVLFVDLQKPLVRHVTKVQLLCARQISEMLSHHEPLFKRVSYALTLGCIPQVEKAFGRLDSITLHLRLQAVPQPAKHQLLALRCLLNRGVLVSHVPRLMLLRLPTMQFEF